MATLLPNGNIRMSASATSPDGMLTGLTYEDVAPDEAGYKNCIPWLNESDMEPAREYLRRAQLTSMLPRISIHNGEKIVIGKFAGTEVKINGIDHIVVKKDDVLAVLE